VTSSQAVVGIAEAFLPAQASSKGVGGPTGVQACARAILVDTQRDNKVEAEWVWDRLRAAIRKLPADLRPQAWALVQQALTGAADTFNQQFSTASKGGDL
jgi:hypothetical protein